MPGRQFAEPLEQFIGGDVEGPGQVALREFVGRPHVQQRHAAFAQAAEQFVARDGLEAVATILAVGHQATDLAAVVLRHGPERIEQPGDRRGAEPVIHMLAIAPGRNETGAAQLLQMLRSVGDRQA